MEGFESKAVLRWRLAPGAWKLSEEGDEAQVKDEGNVLRALSVSRGGEGECRLVTGWESRYYLEKTELPVLEVEVREACSLVSEFRWAA